jgi:hypothetical protein
MHVELVGTLRNSPAYRFAPSIRCPAYRNSAVSEYVVTPSTILRLALISTMIVLQVKVEPECSAISMNASGGVAEEGSITGAAACIPGSQPESAGPGQAISQAGPAPVDMEQIIVPGQVPVVAEMSAGGLEQRSSPCVEEPVTVKSPEA